MHAFAKDYFCSASEKKQYSQPTYSNESLQVDENNINNTLLSNSVNL